MVKKPCLLHKRLAVFVLNFEKVSKQPFLTTFNYSKAELGCFEGVGVLKCDTFLTLFLELDLCSLEIVWIIHQTWLFLYESDLKP